MKIAIIGAGFTGLSAAYYLTKKNHQVTLFEKDDSPGGLAVGFSQKEWEWSLEKHYHHWFTNDKSVLGFAKEIGYKFLIKRSKTSVYLDSNIYQLDSLNKVLIFPKLNLYEKLRMAAVIGLLRYNPFWKPLEKIKAADFLSKTMGKNAYEKIWEPQLINKFGKYANDISLAWFWARLVKRTSSLAYPEGGFLNFANALVEKIKQNGGKVFFNTEVTELKRNEKLSINYTLDAKRYTLTFDAVVVTLPSFSFIKIAPQLPNDYKNKLTNLKGLGSLNLVLRLKKQFLEDGTYWLSICEKNSPIMAVVEHTNFMDKKYYNNEHIIYLGNYLPYDHPHMKMGSEALLKIYDPFLKKINPNYKLSIISYQLFKAPFSQPIIPINYSKIMPPFETPIPNVYLANIQQVYPWDRGTNYAVELGEKIAKIINKNEKFLKK
ncbi:MAG: FAD-dependent oxidoreductase [Candidatus Levybacteria bacterium]|nr:FAD-dependent oxidoreductase [Candidatus Levybacteria bacterium]